MKQMVSRRFQMYNHRHYANIKGKKSLPDSMLISDFGVFTSKKSKIDHKKNN